MSNAEVQAAAERVREAAASAGITSESAVAAFGRLTDAREIPGAKSNTRAPLRDHAAHAPPPELAKAIGRPPEARERTVIEVEFRRGAGCCEEDPVRIVRAYYATDGTLLAERDTPWSATLGSKRG
jgi:hypothetical protein